jgi:serine/threonine-protein kinase RsbW
MDQTYNVTLSSTFDQAETMPDLVDKIAKECKLDEDSSETFKLILSEAVTNAIVHGNQEVPDKSVYVKVSVSDKSISAEVKDEGEGFNHEQKKDPLKEENLLNTGGRGIFLIKQFSDHMEFRENGTLLHFRVDF